MPAQSDRSAPTADAPPERTRAWHHPALLALSAALVIVLAAFAPAMWTALTQPPGGGPFAAHDAPWESDVTADGAVRVFGLRVPGSTLADVRARWGGELQVALMMSTVSPSAREGVLSLEAYVENARPAGIAGRLLLTAEVSPGRLEYWRQRAAKDELVSPQTRRLTLQPEDLEAAMQASIRAVGFIPGAQLDATTLRQRFGEPDEIVAGAAPLEHWLYPRRGLAIVVDPRGRELLQYVALAEFEPRLVAPLRQAKPAPPGVKPADAPAAGRPG